MLNTDELQEEEILEAVANSFFNEINKEGSFVATFIDHDEKFKEVTEAEFLQEYDESVELLNS